MHTATTVTDVRRAIAALPRPVGFVPTMGALHAGHLRLVEMARNECKSVVASLFVNPLQFGANEDLETYPRDIDRDTRKLADADVAVLFHPNIGEMYPKGFSTTVDVGSMGTTFEGAIRPEHFRGVATVVTKLLNIVLPDVLYLGQKDAQQTAVLRKVVRDLAIPAQIRIVPTARERDGLALSSRNIYLNETDRAAAPNLYRALEAFRVALTAGAAKRDARATATALLENYDYLDVVDMDTFEPLETLRAPAFIIGAARFGTTRLIDNVWIAA